ncbi:MAG: methyltransferase [Spirochaetes bacterium]|nr:methyltransferase [Spirochaetota bacterium]
MNNFVGSDTLTTSEAKLEAQKITFAPFIFQVATTMRNCGILKLLNEHGDQGLTIAQITAKELLPEYSTKVLLDAALSIGIVRLENENFILTKTGYFLLNDHLTNVQLNFVNDVCYEAMQYLEESLKTQSPKGLQVFGKWETLYPALSSLPAKSKKSWFEFDHYFSDHAFPRILPIIFKDNPQTLLDIGGNTGKWAMKCVTYHPDVQVTILDLPPQLKIAQQNIQEAKLENRIKTSPIDLLKEEQAFPKGFDIIWMSQFLDCFSEEQIVSILKRAKNIMENSTRLYILETFVDNQRFEAATFSLNMISLYFTCLANGNSRMYHLKDFRQYIDHAGLEIEEEITNISISHTLLKCKRK